MPALRSVRLRRCGQMSPGLRQFLAEMLGTFILIIFGNGSVAQAVLSKGTDGSALSIHWSWGFAVAFGVSSAVGVSGGHINPAVSVAMATLGRLPWIRVPVYMLGQYVGSFLASVVVYLVYMDAINHYDGGERSVEGPNATAGIFCTYPKPYVTTWTGFGDQIFGTAILLICVMAVTDSRHVRESSASPPSPPSTLTPFYIGGSVVVIGMTFGHNCGYAINPARDLAPRIFTAIAGWGVGPFSFRDYNWFWVPVVGPHIGAVLGAFLYQLLVGARWPASTSVEDTDSGLFPHASVSGTPNIGTGKVNQAADLESVKPAMPSVTELQKLPKDSKVYMPRDSTSNDDLGRVKLTSLEGLTKESRNIKSSNPVESSHL